MKQAMTLFLCACALPTALLLPHARSEGVITLKSGEKLPGSMDTMNRPYLKVRSSILSKPVDVHMGELDELASSRPLEIPEQFSIIRLANGDEVYGTLKALDAENLQLQTAWGGLLQVEPQICAPHRVRLTKSLPAQRYGIPAGLGVFSQKHAARMPQRILAHARLQ